MYNQDLEVLGVGSDPRFVHDVPNDSKLSEKLQKQNELYGFDERECWGLSNSLARWLYTHLLLFKRTSHHELKDIGIEFEGKELSLDEAIDQITKACAEFILNDPYLVLPSMPMSEEFVKTLKLDDIDPDTCLTLEDFADFIRSLNDDDEALFEKDANSSSDPENDLELKIMMHSTILDNYKRALRLVAHIIEYLWS